MPTYTVHAAAGTLSREQKASLARALTRAHEEATGAQGFFAQVIFADIPAGDHFVGGEPLAVEHVFVHGQIRAGRTPAQKGELLEAIASAVLETTGARRHAVWVYLLDLEPAQMMEYGAILPPPGGEAGWLRSLDADTRERLLSASDPGMPATRPRDLVEGVGDRRP